MQDETDEAKRQKYSEVIITETERMSRLITTLLDLSALENGATQLRPERFDFVDFLETVAGRLLIDTRTQILFWNMNCRSILSMSIQTKGGWNRS